MNNITTHCQICGRPIKAVKGLISHHGYKRPGGGWQTASCLGAKYPPYEVSRSRLPDVIHKVELFEESQSVAFNALVINPPDTLTYERYNGAGNPPIIRVVRRPDGFKATDHNNFIPGSYVNLFHKRKSDLLSNIQQAKRDLEFFRLRYVNWGKS